MTLHHDKTLAIKNLIWLLQQPDLVNPEQLGSHPHPTQLHANEDLVSHLQELGKILDANKSHFLGAYVESLWQYYLRSSQRYELLAHNLQVHEKGATIGEFDFIVKDKLLRSGNPFIHQELAIKFYLGLPGRNNNDCLWFGPNQIDRLDLKVAHLKNQQLRLSKKHPAQTVLSRLGASPEVKTETILRGRLFLPANAELQQRVLAQEKDTTHIVKGLWYTVDEFLDLLSGQSEVKYWILEKPQWMSLSCDSPAEQHSRLADKLIQLIGKDKRSLLLKRHIPEMQSEDALFVVHNRWHEDCYQSLADNSPKPLQP